MPRRIRCVAVGDTGVGKTSLLFAFVTKTFRTRYIPAVCDIDPLDVKLDDIKESVSIDVMEALGDDGSEDNELRRPICDPKTDVFLVCFSLSHRKSYTQVLTKWHPELKQHSPAAAIILVGTKLDTRTDKEYFERNQAITTEEGIQLAKEIGAVKYLECSALTQQGVKEVLEAVARVGLLVIQNQCCLLF